MCSEQQVVDCSYAYENYACNGGWPVNVWKYVAASKGLDKTASYPYTQGRHKVGQRPWANGSDGAL